MKRGILAGIICLVMGFAFVTTSENAFAEDTVTDPYEIIFITKAEGVTWFDMMKEGVAQFNEEHTDAVCTQISPDSVDAAKQSALVEDYIAQGVDAICVVPIDQSALEPVIEKAKEAGILFVTHEGESLAGKADWDFEACRNEVMGQTMAEQLATAMGGKGKYCTIVGGLTMETHMIWIDSAVAYLKENYPDMELVNEVPYEDGDDVTAGYNLAKEICKTYPDLGGVISATMESGMGWGMYLQETENNAIEVVGLGIPSAHAEYLKAGYLYSVMCGDPRVTGYVIPEFTYRVLRGDTIETGMNLEREDYENMTVEENGIVKGDSIVIFTAENCDQYPF